MFLKEDLRNTEIETQHNKPREEDQGVIIDIQESTDTIVSESMSVANDNMKTVNQEDNLLEPTRCQLINGTNALRYQSFALAYAPILIISAIILSKVFYSVAGLPVRILFMGTSLYFGLVIEILHTLEFISNTSLGANILNDLDEPGTLALYDL